MNRIKIKNVLLFSVFALTVSMAAGQTKMPDELTTATIDGQISHGYCNAADFMCIDPNIANYRRGRQTTGRLGTARLGINKISSRISGATSSLMP